MPSDARKSVLRTYLCIVTLENGLLTKVLHVMFVENPFVPTTTTRLCFWAKYLSQKLVCRDYKMFCMFPPGYTHITQFPTFFAKQLNIFLRVQIFQIKTIRNILSLNLYYAYSKYSIITKRLVISIGITAKNNCCIILRSVLIYRYVFPES